MFLKFFPINRNDGDGFMWKLFSLRSHCGGDQVDGWRNLILESSEEGSVSLSVFVSSCFSWFLGRESRRADWCVRVNYSCILTGHPLKQRQRTLSVSGAPLCVFPVAIPSKPASHILIEDFTLDDESKLSDVARITSNSMKSMKSNFY